MPHKEGHEDKWADISSVRKRAIRAEMAKRLKARGRVRGAVSRATGKKVGELSKAVGKKSSLAGAGLSATEIKYAQRVRSAKKKSGATKTEYRAAAAKGKKQAGPKDPSKGNVKTATTRAKASDYAYNVEQREKTKSRIATARGKTKAHLAKLRKKGVSAATMTKARTKAKARYAKIKGKSKRQRTIIN